MLNVLGVLLVSITVTPSWEVKQVILLTCIFFSALIFGVFFLVLRWEGDYQSQGSLKVLGWVKSIVASISIIIGVPFMFLLTLMSVGQGYMGPTFIKKVTLADVNLYLYYKECYIPDVGCECDDYFSTIYVKNSGLPIMHLLIKVDYYAGDIQIINDTLVVSASPVCPDDNKKTRKIKL